MFALANSDFFVLIDDKTAVPANSEIRFSDVVKITNGSLSELIRLCRIDAQRDKNHT